MAKKTIPSVTTDIADYRHDDAKRKNNPPAGLAGRGTVESLKKQVYAYDAHLPPVLRFDQTGRADALPELLQKARSGPLSDADVRVLAEALRREEPWLEWSGKREKKRVEVDPVALHIHERVSARAILQVAARQTPQRSLFADPVQSYKEAVQFYQHDVGWSNRLVLGDSLAVMSSLAVRENLAGKVQMIYMDPPYGIRFASNFQPVVGQRDVKDKESDLTREPEVVKAFRDTWELGYHTYLSYLRDRLRVARDLLTETGSVFVQISDENLHRVRMVMDEVFRPENFCSVITVKKTGAQTSQILPRVSDFILWYAKDASKVKYRQLYKVKKAGEGAGSGERYDQLELGESGVRRPQTTKERKAPATIPAGSRPWRLTSLRSSGFRENTTVNFDFHGRTFHPGANQNWKTTIEGLGRLVQAERVARADKTIEYVRYLDDFPAFPVTNLWDDTAGSGDKVYVVQTSPTVIERCLLMTTDPGDLVLDPTCGSGTTAVVAEQWGRRWITVDSSRVALFVSRQRLLTSVFDYYRLQNSQRGVSAGFACKAVPHITLKSIAQNKALDPIFVRHAAILDGLLAGVNAALGGVAPSTRGRLEEKLAAKRKAKNPDDPVTEADERRWLLPKERWEGWEVPFDTDPDWPQALQDAVVAYRAAWRAKMDEVRACIDKNADQEELVDQPEIDRKVLRVSGPFTVEGVEPMADTLDDPSPVAGPEGDLPLFVADSAHAPYGNEAANADAYIDKMLRLLRADGVRFMNNKQARIERLDRRSGSVLQAEGEWVAGEGEPRRLSVAVGPQYGPVTARAVEQAIRAAARGGFDDLVVAGFAFDAEATSLIEDDPDRDVRVHLAHIRPDVQLEDLLKDSPNSQIFTVFGSPRSRVDDVGGGEFVAHMEGMDVYDPVTNTLQPTGADKVAAWFVDIDYDGRTFCVSQAFFPDRTAWEKIARALKGTVDPEAFERFAGKKSHPFTPGPNRRVAVKVIDPRGNEVMRVHDLPGGR